MSGGVDSSVAAALTLRQGYTCIGCTMKLFSNEDAGLSRSRTCCSLEDVEDARDVAWRLGIPYHVFNFTAAFRETVIDPFVRCYEAGMTPNPCIACNRYLKFGALLDRARVLGCDRIVTGHYARIERENGRYVLKKALDETRDQSYVLYFLTQDQLAHILFPLGCMRKEAVRQLAERHGFGNARKPDSQDICFVPDGDHAAMIARYRGKPPLPGDFLAPDGSVLGTHRGIVRYTVGQRRGLGISAPEPLYVCQIDAAANTVTLGPASHLFHRAAEITDFHWIAGEPPPAPIRCKARIRYRQPEQPATAIPTGTDTVRLIFDAAQRAVTPGQAAVLYRGDTVLGGGVIAGAGD